MKRCWIVLESARIPVSHLLWLRMGSKMSLSIGCMVPCTSLRKDKIIHRTLGEHPIPFNKMNRPCLLTRSKAFVNSMIAMYSGFSVPDTSPATALVRKLSRWRNRTMPRSWLHQQVSATWLLLLRRMLSQHYWEGYSAKRAAVIATTTVEYPTVSLRMMMLASRMSWATVTYVHQWCRSLTWRSRMALVLLLALTISGGMLSLLGTRQILL